MVRYKYIRSLRVVNKLIEKGHVIQEVKPSEKMNNTLIFKFINNDDLQKDLTEVFS